MVGIVACADDTTTGPTRADIVGYEPARGVSVYRQGDPSQVVGGLAAPLLGPVSLTDATIDGQRALYIAEGTGLRVIRYPIVSSVSTGGVPSVELAEPEVVASASAAVGSLPVGTRMGVDVTSGQPLAVADDGTMVVRAVDGHLYIVSAGIARRLSLGLAAPADGRRLGAVDTRQFGFVAFSKLAEEPGLLLVGGGRVFWSASAPEMADQGVLTSLLGSGAAGRLVADTLASSAPFDSTAASAGLDDDGNLFVMAGTGQLVVVRRVDEPNARVELLAGGGDTLGDVDDPLESFVQPTRPGLHLKSDGTTRTLTFSDDDAPRQLVVDLAETPARVIAWRRARRRHRSSPPPLAIGDGYVVADSQTGQLVAADFATMDRVVLAGEEGADSRTVRQLLPEHLRPNLVTVSRASGLVVVGDMSSGQTTFTRRDGERGQFALPNPGTTFRPNTNAAVLPPSGPRGELLLLSSPSNIFLIDVESLGVLTVTNSPGVPLTPDQARLTGWRPRQTPDLVGAATSTLVLFDRDRRELLEVEPEGAVDPFSMIWTRAGTGSSPIDRGLTTSLNSLSLERTVSVSVDGTDIVTFVAEDPLRGSLVAVGALPGHELGAVTVAGFSPRGRDVASLVGGGAMALADGARARDVGLVGVTDALVFDGALLVAHDVGDAVHLFEVVADVDSPEEGGLIRTVTEAGPPGASPGPVAQFRPRVAELMRAVCFGPFVVVNAFEEGTWAINLGTDEGELLDAPVEPGEVVQLDPRPTVGVGCEPGPTLLVTDVAGPVLVGKEAEVSLPGARGYATVAGQPVVVFDDGPFPILRAGDEGALEQVSGFSDELLDGRDFSRAQLPGTWPVFAADVHEDTPFVGANGEALFVVWPTPTNGYNKSSLVQVVWTGWPLGPSPEAMDVRIDRDADVLQVWLALAGEVYRFDLPMPQWRTPYADNIGAVARIAGGGNVPFGFGEPAVLTDLGSVTGLAVDGSRLWLRFGGLLGYVQDGELRAVAGGGTVQAADDPDATDLMLPASVAGQPGVALDERGNLLVPDPASGVVVRVRP